LVCGCGTSKGRNLALGLPGVESALALRIPPWWSVSAWSFSDWPSAGSRPMNLIKHLTEQKLISPPAWLPDNCMYLTIMGSLAYGVADTSEESPSDFD